MNAYIPISESAVLMLVGMAVVFSFLILLSLVISAASLVTPKLAFMLPDPEPAAPKKVAKKQGGAGAEIALAIAVALKRAGK